MLRSFSSMENMNIVARDGDLGRAFDFLVDDRTWAIRYLVADTGRWLPGRRVLISPSVVRSPDWRTGRLPVELTAEQVKKSPALEEDRPVSMQHEIELHDYYGWTPYWTMHVPVMPAEARVESPAARLETEEGDPHLRSAHELSGYTIDAKDGDMGRVSDFILDTEAWWVRYAVVSTRTWLPGRKVLISPMWLDPVSWSDRQVTCNLTREQIRNSPEYDPSAPVNREYEARLLDYYGRPRSSVSA